MIYKLDCLAKAYASGIKGVPGVNLDGSAYIETDDRSIEEIRDEKKRQVEELRDSLYEQGVKVDTYWFQTSLWSKINFMGIASGSKNYPGWKTLDKQTVTITPAMAGQIMDAIGVQTAAIHTACEAHKAAIDKATDLYGYDINTGWPETFVQK